jgi:5'-methylthioadenosine phosphorylase
VTQAQVAVIGGSGFYEMEGLRDIEQVSLDTPFGPPSDAVTVGVLHDVHVAFLPRHGIGHRILPSELPARANIWALKSLGVERVVAVSAVGSLREDIAPLHAVVPDQLIDRTRGRTTTFFGEGLVAHVSFETPFCPTLSRTLADATTGASATVHRRGTGVVIEGPTFSTKAESFMYRSWGADIIGMTALPEAKLAREAELCYAQLALVTDYDVWHESHDPVTAEMIIENLNKNVEMAKRAVASALASLPDRSECSCGQALASALITPPDLVPEETKRRLGPIIERYMPVGAAV